jgi:hypothetical protein
MPRRRPRSVPAAPDRAGSAARDGALATCGPDRAGLRDPDRGHGPARGLPGADSGIPGRLGDQQHRRGLDQRRLLHRHARRGRSRHRADRSARRQARVRERTRDQRPRRVRLCRDRGWRVVGRGLARAPGGRLRRHLHAGAEALDRPLAGRTREPRHLVLHRDLLSRRRPLVPDRAPASTRPRLARDLRVGRSRPAGGAAAVAGPDPGAASAPAPAGGPAARLPTGPDQPPGARLCPDLRPAQPRGVRVQQLARSAAGVQPLAPGPRHARRRRWPRDDHRPGLGRGACRQASPATSLPSGSGASA